MTSSCGDVKVLIALHSFEAGGVERDILRMAPAWREGGIDARIALGRREGILEHEAPDVPYYQMQKGLLSTGRIETLWMIAKLPAVIRKVRPDVVFFASNGLVAVAAAMRLILGRRCPPMVLRVSNNLIREDVSAFARAVDRVASRTQAKTFAAIVAMAQSLRAEILDQFGIAPERAVVIDNASMTRESAVRFAEARDHGERNHSGRHFLAVGRLMPQKNFTLLLDAFARIARPEDRLTILGEGKLRTRLVEQAERLGIADRFELPGHRFDSWRWFASHDAFVLSSDFEGLPAVIVEALAAGIPIVATNCAASLPMLVEGAGRLVPIRDVDALAEAIDVVLDEVVDVDAMRARAARFTTEATTARWRALFESIAAKRGFRATIDPANRSTGQSTENTWQ